MSALTDRLYREWLGSHRRDDVRAQGLALEREMAKREAERLAWLRDALLLGPERSVGRGRSAPAKRSPN